MNRRCCSQSGNNLPTSWRDLVLILGSAIIGAGIYAFRAVSAHELYIWLFAAYMPLIVIIGSCLSWIVGLIAALLLLAGDPHRPASPGSLALALVNVALGSMLPVLPP